MARMDTRSALARLIDSARTPEKLSYQDISDLASRRGWKMSKSNVNRLVNQNPLTSISGDNIRGLAAALGISERRVAVAALASMGVEIGEQHAPLRQAVLDAVEVGESTKRVILTIINEAMHRPDLVQASGLQIELGSQNDFELAARKPPPGGSRGRQLRRDQDDASTGSQDPGGPGGDA